MTPLLTTLSVIGVFLLLAGCSSPPIQLEPDGGATVESRDTGESPNLQQWLTNSSQTAQTGHANAADPNAPPVESVVLFDLNSSEIRADVIATLRRHGVYLATHPQAKVTLLGHGDEQGTREYNLALGERRVQVISQFLMAEGAGASQLKLFSYGEERPASSTSQAQNRRVQLLY